VPLIGRMTDAPDEAYSYTAIGFSLDPWWMIDFGISGVPIKEVLLVGPAVASWQTLAFNAGHNVHVGE